MYDKELFERFFNGDGRQALLGEDEIEVAAFVVDIAENEMHAFETQQKGKDGGDADSVLSFDIKADEAIHSCDEIVEKFANTYKARKTFLEKFDRFSHRRKNNSNELKEIAEGIQTDKFNCDVATVTGSVAGVLGGIALGLSMIPPLAPVTLPLAIAGGAVAGVGGGVVGGTALTGVLLLKSKLKRAQDLLKVEQDEFADMAHWFTHTDELNKAIESLIDRGLLKELYDDVATFLGEVKDAQELLQGEKKRVFGQVVQLCSRKMFGKGKVLSKFGNKIAPFIVGFLLLVCLVKARNRVILSTVLLTQRLAVGLLSTLDVGTAVCRAVFECFAEGAATAGKQTVRLAVIGTLVAVGIAIDVINMVLSSIDIHTRAESEHAVKLRDAAVQLDKEHSFIESIYKELSQSKVIAPSDVKEFETVFIRGVPESAESKHVKSAVCLHFPREAWYFIKARKLRRGWLVEYPTSHSLNFMIQSHVDIEGKRCEIFD